MKRGYFFTMNCDIYGVEVADVGGSEIPNRQHDIEIEFVNAVLYFYIVIPDDPLVQILASYTDFSVIALDYAQRINENGGE